MNRPSAPLAERIRAGDDLVGLTVKMPSAAIIEMAGYCGFDLVVLDCEHGPADMEALEHHLRAADSVQLPALVRVGNGDRSDVLRALDAGAAGIVFPHASDVSDVRNAVNAAHYPPLGRRGLATSTRAGRQGTLDVQEHVARAARRTVVLAQVEDAVTLPHVADMAAEPHLDAIFLGPTDLAMSLGHPGDPDHPTVISAMEEAAAKVARVAGIALCVAATDADDARRWRARGAQIILFTAQGLISRCLRGVVDELGETSGSAFEGTSATR